MDRFDGLSNFCTVLSILGGIAVAAGLLVITMFFETSQEILVLVGSAAIGSGIGIMLMTGAIKILIGIYQNTFKAE